MVPDPSRAADRVRPEAEDSREGRGMTRPPRTASTVVFLVGLAVSIGAAVWLLAVERQLNLLGSGLPPVRGHEGRPQSGATTSPHLPGDGFLLKLSGRVGVHGAERQVDRPTVG